MTKTIILKDASIKNYASFLRLRNSEIDSQIKPLLDEKQDNLRQLNELGINPNDERVRGDVQTPVILFDSNNVYEKDMSRVAKSVFAITQKQRALNVNEIIRELGQHFEPELISTPEEERENIRKFSTGLKQNVDSGKLSRVNDAKRGFIYGPNQWFENGKLKDGYK